MKHAMLSYFNYYYIFFSKQLSTNCAFVNNTVNSVVAVQAHLILGAPFVHCCRGGP